jgi:two-component system nitrate/nitrite response regulator NarL
MREFEIVSAVSDGSLAVGAVTGLKPDAVLLDIHMPRMSGLEAAQQLRNSGSSTKIIFLTIEKDPE